MSILSSKGVAISIIVSVVLGSLIGFSISYATLQPSINNMQKAYVSANLKDDKLSNMFSHNIKGTVINFGTSPASNITIIARWFNEGASFHQEIITIPSLPGKTMKDLSFSYVFGGSADDFQYSITWN